MKKSWTKNHIFSSKTVPI